MRVFGRKVIGKKPIVLKADPSLQRPIDNDRLAYWVEHWKKVALGAARKEKT